MSFDIRGYSDYFNLQTTLVVSATLAAVHTYMGREEAVIGLAMGNGHIVPIRHRFEGDETARNLAEKINPTIGEQGHGGEEQHQFDVVLRFADAGGQASIQAEFADDNRTQVKSQRFERLVFDLSAQMLKDPEIKIRDLSLVTPEEKEMLLNGFNHTDSEFRTDETMVHLFESAAAKSPDHVAVVFGEERVMYRELNEWSNRVARALQLQGVKAQEIVPILVTRSPQMIAGMLGILKAGAAFLPIDPDFPRERIEYMLEDAQVRLLLTEQGLRGDVQFDGERVDVQTAAFSDLDGSDLQAEVAHTDLMYALYTSGSTGRPKGVLIEHGTFAHLARVMENQSVYPHTDTLLNLTTVSFDAFHLEVFLPLVYGKTVVVANEDQVTDAAAICQLVEKHNITGLWMTPARLQLFLSDPGSRTSMSRIRAVAVGGEALPGALAERVFEWSDARLFNQYGPTEVTVMCTMEEVLDESDITIGRPLPNMMAYVLGPHLNLLPPGVPGELCISGAGVGRGYLNRPELTQEKFVEHPLLPGERLYRTGDLVKWTPEGKLIYLGRLDDQVKVRGYRIELGEIETVLAAHEAVQEAVVTVRQNEAGENYLCAYVVPHAEASVTQKELRAAVQEQLPAYMVPSYFVELDSFPVTIHGKVDRKALPEPDADLDGGSEYISPVTPAEHALVAIWEQVLGLGRVGVEDHFLALGGDSIKAIRALAMIHEQFPAASLSVRDLYKAPGIRDLAESMEGAAGQCKRSAREQATADLEALKQSILANPEWRVQLPADLEDLYPMSDISQGMVYYALKHPEQTVYHTQMVYQLDLPHFDLDVWKQALALLVDKHVILRSSFHLTDFAAPLQVVHTGIAPHLAWTDLKDMQADQQEAQIAADLQSDLEQPFEIAKAPLWRMHLYQLDAEMLGMTFTFHHAILDGWSDASLIAELVSTYQALRNDPASQAGRLASDCKDFLIDQAVTRSDEEIVRFWRIELDLYKRLQLPIDPELLEQNVQRTVNTSVDDALAAKVKQTAQRLQTSVKTVGFAAYLYALHMLSYEKDMVVGLIEESRPLKEDGDKILGCFLNTVPVRILIEKDQTWEGLIRACDQKLTDLKHYGRLSLMEIAKAIGETGKQENPVVDTIYNFIDFHVFEQAGLSGCLQNSLFNLQNFERTNTLLDVNLIASGNRMQVLLKSTVLSEEQLHQLTRYFVNTMRAFAEQPAETMSKRTVMPESEQHRLLVELNDTAADYRKDVTVHGLIGERIGAYLDRTAVMFDDKLLTYRDLEERTNRLARTLRAKGVVQNQIVGIMAERSVEMIVGIHAILKAGGAYLPINPDFPEDRIQYMLENSETKLLLTQNRFLDHVAFEGEVLDLEVDALYADDASALPEVNGPQDLAYVIYTSGSTGKPKGVMIEHWSLINRLNWMQNRYPIGAGDVIMQKTPFTFDVSVWEMFWWALEGAAVFFLEPGGEKDPLLMKREIGRRKVTTMHFVPSMLSVFLEEVEHESDLSQLATLKQVFASGEALQVHQVSRFYEMLHAANGTHLYNLYGPTEATVDVSYFDCVEGTVLKLIPIGKPIDNTQLYILDQNDQLQPIGVPGELCIGGDNLARGYLNNPELTAEKFVPSPFAEGERIYKTGDLARWMADGNIEYLGRMDHQVKIRGLRIELGEIEHLLLQHPAMKEAVVVARDDARGQKYLCAYYVAEREISFRELRDHLIADLPEYMVPSHLMQLDAMPLSPNGKLDRKLLPEPQTNFGNDIVYEAPRNEAERLVAEIWQNILGIETIGIHDDFLTLGGDSIMAIRITSALKKATKVDVKIRDLYEYTVLSDLAVHIGQQETGSAEAYLQQAVSEIASLKQAVLADESLKSKLPAGMEDFYPMSDIEQGMVYHTLQMPEAAMYHDQFFYQLHDPSFDKTRFERALQLLVQKHPILRTGFNLRDFPVTMQLVMADVELDIEHADLTHLDPLAQGEAVESFMATDRQAPFDITRAPLWRMRVFKLDEEHVGFLWIFHHAILDGWSVASFVTELLTVYKRLSEQADFAPDMLDSSYKDYMIEQYAAKNNGDVLAFWRKELDEYKRLQLPVQGNEHRREAVTILAPLDQDLYEQLQKVAQQQRISLKTLGFTAYLYTMNLLSYENDVVVGLVENNRPITADGDKILGCFLNTVPVRMSFEPGMTWEQLAQKTERKLVDLKHYGRLSLLEIAKAIGESAHQENPIFDSLFNYVDFHVFDALEDNLLTDGVIDVEDYERTNTVLDIILSSTGGQFEVLIRSHVLTEEQLQGLLDSYRQALHQLAYESQKALDKADLLSAAEKQKLLNDFNDTDAGYPQAETLHTLIEMQAAERPDHIAVTCNGETLTYRELNSRANQLARVLRGKGVGPDALVAIMVDRSLEMIVGMVGILKAGGAYLPVDPTYPSDRIQFMLEDSGTKILLTTQDLFGHADFTGETLDLNAPAFYQGDDTDLPSVNTPDDLCYIIYTSGTTGKPKGVMISHRNVVRLLINDHLQFTFTDADAWTMFHSFCFDFSVWEMYGALLYGGKLVMVPKRIAQSPQAFRQLLIDERVTVLNQTPTAFASLIYAEMSQPESLLSIRYVIFGGEALKPLMLKEWKERYPNTKLINMYGITETTVHVTFKEIGDEEIRENVSNIGVPIPTLGCYIVDSYLNLLPMGVVGELCVSGLGVARGYLHRPELTAQRFIDNPYKPGERLYRSGDLARFLPNGEMEYLGRIDHQVKIRGFRIELGEIEHKFLKHEAVLEAAVLARTDKQGDQSLCAYFIAEQELTVNELRQYLLEDLPDYMVPAHFVQLPQMPITPNGKVDRKALPEPNHTIDTGAEYIAPRTEAEVKLASIWERVLGVETISMKDHFFELGGDSIKAIRMIDGINRTFGVEFQLREFYQHLVVQDLAAVLEQQGGRVTESRTQEAAETVEAMRQEILADESLRGLLPDGAADVFPMSDIQLGMVFHSLQDADTAMYHDQFSYQMQDADFDFDRMAQAMTLLADKHAILRTGFRLYEFAHPMQVVVEQPAYDMEYMDLAGLAQEVQEAEIERVLADDRTRPFAVEQAPLWRLKAFRSSETNVVLTFIFHHAILDGWSLASLVTELFDTYDRLKDEPFYQPEELSNTYKQYIVEQLAMKRDIEIKQYWQKELEDSKRLQLSALSKTGQQEGLGMILETWDADWVPKLEAKAQELGTNVRTLCFTAYLAALHMFSYESDIVVGLVENNRPLCVDGDKLIGCFLNTVPVRFDLGSNRSWRELVGAVDAKLIELKHYGRLPLPEVMKAADISAADENALFDMIFNFIEFHIYEDLKYGASVTGGELNVENYERTNTLFDFTVSTTFGEFLLNVGYDRAMFDEQLVARLISYFKNALTLLVEETESIASKADVLPQEERVLLLETFNGETQPLADDQLVHGIFEDVAARYPERTAVSHRDRSITYRELNELANRLARVLREQGVGRETIVALMSERTVEAVMAILAVFKAGGAYVPIDPNYPADRIAHMLRDSQSHLLLTDGLLHADVVYGGKVLDLNDPSLFAGDASNLEHVNRPEDLLYMIYTSGTTGLPKGVMIEHRNLVNRWESWQQAYGLRGQTIKALQLASLAFDVFVGDLTKTILLGGELVICPDEVKLELPELYGFIEEQEIQLIDSTPSFMVPLFDYIWDNQHPVSHLKYLIVGADAIHLEDFRRMVRRFGDRVRVINGYGVTEVTVEQSLYEEPLENITAQGNAPIGRPMPSDVYYVLSQHLDLQPQGVLGELCIAGESVARGYFNRPDLTAEKFVEHPFQPGVRLYRTGDLVRWLEDGNVDFAGRIDNQLKIRGFRVELGEIEEVLAQHPLVTQAVVHAVEDRRGDKQLAAYLVGETVSQDEQKEQATADIRRHLASKLPAYMVPVSYLWMTALPLTPNGKIDRKALPAPNALAPGAEEIAPPRDRMEFEMVKVWERVLQIEPIGIHDHFFEHLGGHSIKAMQLMEQIRRTFDVKFPVTMLYQAATVAGLCSYIREQDLKAKDGLVQLQQGTGDASPLYLIHPFGGGVMCYLPLVAGLGKEETVYGLQAFGYESDEPLLFTVEDMADAYIEQIRSVQQQGPYRLLGWSFGGKVAYEIARHLEQAGEQVTYLGLIDTYMMNDEVGVKSGSVEHGFDLSELASVIGLYDEDLDGLAEAEAWHLIQSRGAQLKQWAPDAPVESVKRLLAVMAANERARRGFQAQGALRTDIHLYLAQEIPDEVRALIVDPQAWSRQTAGRLYVETVPGDHNTMVETPHVTVLSEKIKKAFAISDIPQKR